jgi:hypothetical protein
MSIDKSVLGTAGEFAVAAELCRRNIYAQLTLGNQKRIDLLTLSHSGVFLKFEVKSKQYSEWPQVKGPSKGEAFLVFVDFAKKLDTERPDFYILNKQDWYEVANEYIAAYLTKHPDRTAHLDEENCPVHPEELNRHGKPYRGCTIRVANVEKYREAWSKVVEACAQVTESVVRAQ